MHTIQNVFLIGPMGVGKSTIGRLLALQLGKPFFDSDREIEKVTGADIPWIFDVEGEQGFRVREARMIDTLSQRQNIVLATGGGAILSPESRRFLHDRGTVVYLKASVAQQMERTGKDKNRPLLQTEDPLAKIKELIGIREPLYQETAHLTIDTSRRSPRYVVAEIMNLLQAQFRVDPESSASSASGIEDHDSN